MKRIVLLIMIVILGYRGTSYAQSHPPIPPHPKGRPQFHKPKKHYKAYRKSNHHSIKAPKKHYKAYHKGNHYYAKRRPIRHRLPQPPHGRRPPRPHFPTPPHP